jgi:acyl dehydratase
LKISADIVGQSTGPDEQRIDKRWLMAYNAALGEVSDAMHPLFPVSYEWPATTALRKATGLQELNARLVHAQHDLVIHRPVVAGEALAVTARVVSATQRRPGTFVVFRLSCEASTSHYGMLYRGVTLQGGDRGEVDDPPKHERELSSAGSFSVSATAGHVYTECARIWNPIHTDPEYARAAGLPGIILHGTATLALSVSRLTKTAKRVRCRFSGMVPMPATLTVHASRAGDEILFETRNERGEAVIERGRIG